MKMAELCLLDFEPEMEKTRSFFSILPEDKADWKPHRLSPQLGQLAKHIAMLPGLGIAIVTTESLDASGGPPAFPEFVDRADLMQTLEHTGGKLRELLAGASDEYLLGEWAFRAGEKVLSAAPRAAMYRVMFMNHFVHHRAQLGLYLRLLDVPLPGSYGPSADGPWLRDWPGPRSMMNTPPAA